MSSDIVYDSASIEPGAYIEGQLKSLDTADSRIAVVGAAKISGGRDSRASGPAAEQLRLVSVEACPRRRRTVCYVQSPNQPHKPGDLPLAVNVEGCLHFLYVLQNRLRHNIIKHRGPVPDHISVKLP